MDDTREARELRQGRRASGGAGWHCEQDRRFAYEGGSAACITSRACSCARRPRGAGSCGSGHGGRDGATRPRGTAKADEKGSGAHLAAVKNASHRRVQIDCGCFYGAGSALGVAEARGGQSTRARWQAGPREGRFAIYTLFLAARLAPTYSLPIRPHLVEMACNRYLHNPPPSGNQPHELWSAGEQMRPNGQGGKGGEPPFSTWRAFLTTDLGAIWGSRYVWRWQWASFERGRGG